MTNVASRLFVRLGRVASGRSALGGLVSFPLGAGLEDKTIRTAFLKFLRVS
jgi:hypothetical protein